MHEIQQHLFEIYKVEVSTAVITNPTDTVIEEVKTWQSRSLESVYPIVYFDAIVMKIRHQRKVTNRWQNLRHHRHPQHRPRRDEGVH